MLLDVIQHAHEVTGWDKATAIGTIGGAVATAGAVIAAFVVAQRERKAAADAQAQLLDAQRAKDAREHELDLLLTLGRLVGEHMGNPNGGARLQGRAIVLSLPVTQSMPAVRALFLGTKENHEVFERVYGEPWQSRGASPRLAADEVADRIKVVANP